MELPCENGAFSGEVSGRFRGSFGEPNGNHDEGSLKAFAVLFQLS